MAEEFSEKKKRADECMEEGRNCVANGDFRNACIYFRRGIYIRVDLYGEPCLGGIAAYYQAGYAFYFYTVEKGDNVDEDDELSCYESIKLAGNILTVAGQIFKIGDPLVTAQLASLQARVSIQEGRLFKKSVTDVLRFGLHLHKEALRLFQCLVETDSELIVDEHFCLSEAYLVLSDVYVDDGNKHLKYFDHGINHLKYAISALHSLVKRLRELHLDGGEVSETSVIPQDLGMDELRSFNGKVLTVDADIILRLTNRLQKLEWKLSEATAKKQVMMPDTSKDYVPSTYDIQSSDSQTITAAVAQLELEPNCFGDMAST